MNKTIITTIVLLIVLASFSWALECRVESNQCTNDETTILCLSGSTNAHAELPVGDDCKSPAYQHRLCCSDQNEDGSYNDLSNECRGDSSGKVTWLNALTNAHAATAESTENNYVIPVCISGVKNATCTDSRPLSIIGGRESPYVCVLSISGDDNAHLSQCDQDDYKNIYCSVISDEDYDGSPADHDCDDTDRDVYPGAEEIGDGIDNDCDGLVDGDDSDALPEGWYQLSAKSGFADYKAGGVDLETINTEKKFKITTNSQIGIISKKVRVDKNTNYFASVKTEGCEVKLQLVFDNVVPENEPNSGTWSFLLDFLGVEGDCLNCAEGNGNVQTEAINSTEAEHASILITVKNGDDCLISQPQLERSGTLPADYNDFFQPHFFDNLELPDPVQMTASACCPESSCWNGYRCIKDMGEGTLKFEDVDGHTQKATYRCVNGEWNFAALLKDWQNDQTGFCPNTGQCFVLSAEETSLAESEELETSAETFYQGLYPNCINSGEFIYDHYCEEGKWTSRTKFLAKKLLEIAGDKDHVLYCTSFRDAFHNFDLKDSLLEGVEFSSAVDPLCGQIEDLPGSEGTCPRKNICYSLDAEGTALVPDADNSCLNNVCVLEYQESGLLSSGKKTLFATTLNKEITDQTGSFLHALDISDVENVCPSADDKDFVRCHAHNMDLWYSEKIKGIIYSPESVAVNPGTWTRFKGQVITFFNSFLGRESVAAENEDEEFGNDKDYQNLYILKKGDWEINALKENNFSEGNVFGDINVEYTNFETDICAYADPNKLANEQVEFAALNDFFTCVPEDNVQKVTISTSKDYSDFIWPQLTGMLRVND